MSVTGIVGVAQCGKNAFLESVVAQWFLGLVFSHSYKPTDFNGMETGLHRIAFR